VSAEPDQLPGRLTRLGLKSMRDRLDSLLDEAGRRDLSIRDDSSNRRRASISPVRTATSSNTTVPSARAPLTTSLATSRSARVRNGSCSRTARLFGSNRSRHNRRAVVSPARASSTQRR
jgi:hypothetical protein